MTACRRMLVTWLESHRVWDIVFTDTPAPTRPSPCPRAVAYQYFALAMFYWRATAESCIKDDTIFTTITALVTRYPHFLIRARTRYTPCTRNGQRPVHDSRHGYASQSHSILYTAVHNRYGSYSRYTTKEFLYTAVRSHCDGIVSDSIGACAWRRLTQRKPQTCAARSRRASLPAQAWAWGPWHTTRPSTANLRAAAGCCGSAPCRWLRSTRPPLVHHPPCTLAPAARAGIFWRSSTPSGSFLRMVLCGLSFAFFVSL